MLPLDGSAATAVTSTRDQMPLRFVQPALTQKHTLKEKLKITNSNQKEGRHRKGKLAVSLFLIGLFLCKTPLFFFLSML